MGKTIIKNWRPITLLDVSYKIPAKYWPLELWIYSANLLALPNQDLKGRCILGNIISSWEAIEWVVTSNKNTKNILLHFSKANDRVEWSFFMMTIEAFGFPSGIFQILRTLFNDGVAQVDDNGYRVVLLCQDYVEFTYIFL